MDAAKTRDRTSERRQPEENLLPVAIHLVDDEDLVSNLLLVEERVHKRDELQQLLKPLPEGHDEGQFVRTPRRVVDYVSGARGRELWLGGRSSLTRGDFTRAAELQPEQRDEHEHHAEAEQLVDCAFTSQEPGNAQKEETVLQNKPEIRTGSVFISKPAHAE